MKVVVANSVGIDYRGYKIIHSPSRWTNSTLDRNFFTYYPWELAYTSALLKRETTEEIKFIDGCLEKLDHQKYFEKLIEEKPDYLIMESSTRTINEDLRLALRLKKAIGTKLIFCGQHPTVFPKEVLEGKIQIRPNEDISIYAEKVDFVCLGEYEFTVLDIIKQKEKSNILGIYPNPRRPLIDLDDLPFPEDEDVQRIEYAYPAEPSCEYIEIQAYATRGCPISCSFCVCGNLYYPKPNWRTRNVENIIAEIKYLKNKYPQMEGIFFDEEVHNAGKKFIMDLTSAIIKNKLNNLHYNAMCAYWSMDEEMLIAFKEAGYYLLRIGIETGSEKIAEAMNLKNKFNLKKLFEVLGIAKKVGIDMYGTFTFGGPGSDDNEDKKTLELIYRLMSEGLLRRIQMSITTPQPGTPFYEWADKKGFIISKKWDDYDGGNNVVIEYPYYTRKQIMENYLNSFCFYDRGMEEYWSKNLEKNLMKCFSQFSNLKKILVFRTSRKWHFDKVIDCLIEKYKEIKINVISAKKFEEQLKNDIRLNEVLYYITDYLNLFEVPKKIIENIESERYDMVIVLYSDFAGTGYAKINTLASQCISANKIALNIAGEKFIIKPVSIRRF